jgi:hypothetical protein
MQLAGCRGGLALLKSLTPQGKSGTMEQDELDPRTQALLMALRRALIQALCAVEDALGRERSVRRR